MHPREQLHRQRIDIEPFPVVAQHVEEAAHLRQRPVGGRS
jgi:hypothetical protein